MPDLRTTYMICSNCNGCGNVLVEDKKLGPCPTPSYRAGICPVCNGTGSEPMTTATSGCLAFKTEGMRSDFSNCLALEEEYGTGQWLVYDWVPRYANLRRFATKAEAEAYIQTCGGPGQRLD